MGLISGDCKNCGAKLSFDDSKKKGFCSHCGTEFIVQDTVNQTVQNITIGSAVLQQKEETYAESVLKKARLAMEKCEYGQAREHLRPLLQSDPNNKEAQALLDSIVNLKYTVLGKEVLLTKIEPFNQTFIFAAAKKLGLHNPKIKQTFFAVATMKDFLDTLQKDVVKDYNKFLKESVEQFLYKILEIKSPSNVEIVFTKFLFDIWAKSGFVAAENKYKKSPETLMEQAEMRQMYENELKELKKDKIWRKMLR